MTRPHGLCAALSLVGLSLVGLALLGIVARRRRCPAASTSCRLHFLTPSV